MKSDYVIRNASHQEVQSIFIKWSQAEGWEPAFTDGNLFFFSDPSGFFVGEIDGQIISAICGVKRAHQFAFIGFYLCKKEYRGQGYGIKIFRHCLKYLEGYNIALESVAAQENNYVKSGFKTHSQTSCNWFQGLSTPEADPMIKSLGQVQFATFFEYWTKNSIAFDREFCEKWLSHPDHHTCGYFKDSHLLGFASMRKGPKYHRVGPLIADSPAIALRIVNHLRGLAGPEAKIIINFMDSNQEAVKLSDVLGSKVLYKCARMYTAGQPKQIRFANNYGLTSAEIG